MNSHSRNSPTSSASSGAQIEVRRISDVLLKSSLLSLIATFCIVLLSACASMSEVDCYYTDWFAKGMADGANGATMDKFNRYVKDCSRHGVSPDRIEYIDGRKQGLQTYCTQSRGYDEGKSGGDYEFTCPPSLEPDFLSGYEPGKRLYHAEYEVASINSNIRSLNRSIDKLERDVERLTNDRTEEQLDDSGEHGTDTDTPEEKKAKRLRTIERLRYETAEKQLQLRRLYELKVEVMVNYRETVRAVRDLGFAVVEKY